MLVFDSVRVCFCFIKQSLLILLFPARLIIDIYKDGMTCGVRR